jgi:RNA polymerase sigma-70 factor, ECF subfamily
VVGVAAGEGQGAMTGGEEFARRSDPFRRELLAHCYRMLGSVHDAEDLVQETLLRAWRTYDRFDDRRASLRTWLYRIATNACLTALEQRGRRELPAGVAGPADPEAPLAPAPPEVTWLQPIPDALLEGGSDDPATIVSLRGSVRLALVAALQHLPARQRAVLMLRDVLAWRAAEVAEALDTTTAAVNSALQRARQQLAQAAPAEDEVAEPGDAGQRELLDRYVAAFERADHDALVALLTDDLVVEMPPSLTWLAGRDAFERFLAPRLVAARDPWRMIPTRANGQPAVGAYRRGEDGVHHAHSVQVLTVTTKGVAHIVAFQDPDLFATFGLPQTHPSSAVAPAGRR